MRRFKLTAAFTGKCDASASSHSACYGELDVGDRLTTTQMPRRCEWGVCSPATNSGSNHIRFLLNEVVQRLIRDAATPLIERSLPFGLERPAHFVFGANEILSENPADFARLALDRMLDYWRKRVRCCRFRTSGRRQCSAPRSPTSCASTKPPARSSPR